MWEVLFFFLLRLLLRGFCPLTKTHFLSSHKLETSHIVRYSLVDETVLVSSWWRHQVSNYKVFRLKKWPFAFRYMSSNFTVMIFIITHLIDQDWDYIWKVNVKIVWPLLPFVPEGQSLQLYIFLQKYISVPCPLTKAHFPNLNELLTSHIVRYLSGEETVWVTSRWRHQFLSYEFSKFIISKNHNFWSTWWVITIDTSSESSLKTP